MSLAPFRVVGVVGLPRYGGLGAVVGRLVAFARERDLELRFDEEIRELAPEGAEALDLGADEPDLLLTLGGDGTLLRGARRVAEMGIPVLGINLGRLGFLTSISEDSIEESLERILGGEYVLDPRFTLEAAVVHADGEVEERFLALNDFVVHQAGVARVTRLDLFVGEGEEREEVGAFSGDGVVLATPTGSTAYSLSAGGPLIVPTVECIVVTPIAPHTLAVRPLVIPAGEVVTVHGIDREEALVLTVDGQVGRRLEDGDRVRVRRSEVKVSLVRLPEQSFFSTLRRKLNWAVRSGYER